jgi:phosphatidylglycerol lysyltransferase
VRANALPLYLDAGLTLMKLGEEAHIALDRFDLKGSNRSHLRYALRRGEKDALSVEVIAPHDVPAALPALRDISDGWLDSRDAREKSFSVAAFHDGYLATQSVMLVRQADKPIAFVTFMTTDLNTEATVGVMRHLPEASPYAMEYLLQLALHLKEAGFLKLSLGIAPFSGMGAAKMPSPWHRFGLMVWRFGGRFYNFRGLRAFKSKFEPHWEPRYLAASGSVGVFVTLADLSLLAGGRRS